MELYNSTIKKTQELLSAKECKTYAFSGSDTWSESEEFEMVMMKDVAFELGGSNKAALNYTCVTTDESLVSKDEVVVYGEDLNQIKSDCCYARIAFILVDNFAEENGDDSEQTLRTIQDIDFVKYHVFPKGFMMRTSSESQREQVRISKKAVQAGLTFSKIGNSFIKHYKENSHVKAVKLMFITLPDLDYKTLSGFSTNVKDITMTLSKILEGMPTDCHSCNLKPICDEVEGMKELHFGKK